MLVNSELLLRFLPRVSLSLPLCVSSRMGCHFTCRPALPDNHSITTDHKPLKSQFLPYVLHLFVLSFELLLLCFGFRLCLLVISTTITVGGYWDLDTWSEQWKAYTGNKSLTQQGAINHLTSTRGACNLGSNPNPGASLKVCLQGFCRCPVMSQKPLSHCI